MSDILERFTPRAIETMRGAIRDARGNEVLFVGIVDESRRVDEVEVLSRGNASAAPALIGTLPPGSVAIHNHPSGDLDPSPQDLEVASILGNNGVGFSIVDNGVTRDYQVIPPFFPAETELLDPDDVISFFAPRGSLSRSFPDFEARDEQREMAVMVAGAFNREKIALIEAGTGTGKSFAYLFPSILWATRNHERVVVSTNTINLQEQLLKKDLPLLRKATGIPFRSVLVKGRANYLCLRKIALRSESPSLFDDGRSAELEALERWSRVTSDGSRSDLGFVPDHELWEDLCCEADQCMRVKCRFYNSCFYYAARRRAASADILVINHALLVTDLALKGETEQGAIPPYSRLIIDEAHHLEDAASRHLGMHLSVRLVERTVERLHQAEKPGAGLLDQFLSALGRRLSDSEERLYTRYAVLVEDHLAPSAAGIVHEARRTFDLLALELRKMDGGGPGKLLFRVTDDLRGTLLWQETRRLLESLGRVMSEFVLSFGEFDELLGELSPPVREELDSVLTDMGGVLGRIRTIAGGCLTFIGEGEELCRWYELKTHRGGTQLRLAAAPVTVDTILDQFLFSRMKTVILTSATLSVNERFDYLLERTGIALSDRERVQTSILHSPFDYTNQIAICLPEGLPEPGSDSYRETVARLVSDAVEISGGRAFILFTSYDLLAFVHDHLRRHSGGFTLLRQGDHDRHTLLERFRMAERGVLLGTDSFWEGVDVKGEALELVVITRLPFRVPTDPVQQARCDHLQRQGKDPFRSLTIPQAVIKFKQGVGRLIRSRWDRGVVLVLDGRITSKYYGKSFLRALPAGRIVRGRWGDVARGMREFFSDKDR